MLELESNNRLIFHSAGYEELMPGTLPIPGALSMVWRGQLERDQQGSLQVLPEYEAKLTDVSLFAGFVAVLSGSQVRIATNIGNYTIDPTGRTAGLSLEDELAVLNRFDRIASTELECRVGRQATAADQLRAGALSQHFQSAYFLDRHRIVRGYRAARRDNTPFPR